MVKIKLVFEYEIIEEEKLSLIGIGKKKKKERWGRIVEKGREY